MILKDLGIYLEVDEKKQQAINDLLFPKDYLRSQMKYHELNTCYKSIGEVPTKYCPKCHREYLEEENICFDCLTALRHISDMISVREIKSQPEFPYDGKNTYDDFESILNEDNLARINEFKFSIRQFNGIIRNIKKTALENLDDLIKANELNLNYLSPLDKVLLFSKSFVSVEYKSYGQELGYFEYDSITIDERQTDAFQMTTLIHELSHFLIKEILTQTLCKILNCDKNALVEGIVSFILSYTYFTQLIDEYCAHSTEGRFTVYGYQDYSSFLSIVERMGDEMGKDEIEITKSIGNTFSNSIKDILESFIDHDLRRDIKDEFLSTNFEKPNYEMLLMENCQQLTDEGFIKAIWLILSEGFSASMVNIDKLKETYVKP